MDRHGQYFFPENPHDRRGADRLCSRNGPVGRRAADAQLTDSAQQREELAVACPNRRSGSPELAQGMQLARLDATACRLLRPGADWSTVRSRFRGRARAWAWARATGVMQDLAAARLSVRAAVPVSMPGAADGATSTWMPWSPPAGPPEAVVDAQPPGRAGTGAARAQATCSRAGADGALTAVTEARCASSASRRCCDDVGPISTLSGRHGSRDTRAYRVGRRGERRLSRVDVR